MNFRVKVRGAYGHVCHESGSRRGLGACGLSASRTTLSVSASQEGHLVWGVTRTRTGGRTLGECHEPSDGCTRRRKGHDSVACFWFFSQNFSINNA
jgi:hypothetical protein